MKAYLSLIKLRFSVHMQYRAALFAGLFTQFFFGFVRIMVLLAFYASSSNVQPMSFAQAVTYSWLVQATFRMQPWDTDREVLALVRTGNVAYELCRPLDLYFSWFCRLLALRLVPTIMAGIPLFVIALLFPANYAAAPPASIAAGLAFVASLLGALLLGCAISNVITISALWTIAGDGMQRIFPTAVMFLSGMIIPLPFFPDWMQSTLRFLPFSGLVDTPFRFYIGMIPPSQIFVYLALQVFWTGVIVLIGLRLLSAGTRRLVVQGG